MATVHPDHFAAVGKRVASVFDPADISTVVENGGPRTPVLVRWGSGVTTWAEMHELDIPSTD